MFRKVLLAILLLTLLFIGSGAVYGGAVMLIDPSGKLIEIPLRMLAGSPFSDFLIPGIFLLTVNGFGSFFVFYVLVRKPQWQFFEKFNVIKFQHFSLSYSIYLGIVLICWIGIQIFYIRVFNQLHLRVLISAILMIGIPQFKIIKHYYKSINV